MLGIGLMLFVLRSMYRKQKWNDKLIKFTFWTLNIGLLLMVVLSLLPVGLMQTFASVNEGMWYARSAELLQQEHMVDLRWFRTFGDVVFMIGALTYAWQVIKALAQKEKTTRSHKP